MREGRLREVTHGLYYTLVPSKFGPAPVADEVLLRAFLDGEPFLISGPPRWNALGLGATAMFASTLVYNTLRTGDFTLAGRTFVLRRSTSRRRPRRSGSRASADLRDSPDLTCEFPRDSPELIEFRVDRVDPVRADVVAVGLT